MQSGGCLQTRNSKWTDFELCRAQLSSFRATAAEHWREVGETGWVLGSSAVRMVKFRCDAWGSDSPLSTTNIHILCIKSTASICFSNIHFVSGLPRTRDCFLSWIWLLCLALAHCLNFSLVCLPYVLCTLMNPLTYLLFPLPPACLISVTQQILS